MLAVTFKRGVHPPDRKEMAADAPIQKLEAKEGMELIFPLSQHIGPPCAPLVNVGDEVVIGQKIADSQARLTSPIFASVSGKVTAIGPAVAPNGAQVQAIFITADGKNTTLPFTGLSAQEQASPEKILEAVHQAGIVGMGGAGFPAQVKFCPPPTDTIDTVILNGAECEPYLTCDYRLMLEDPRTIVKGLECMLQLFPDAKGIIGIECNKPKAIESMMKVCEGMKRITVQPLQTKYPQGGEKQLIYALTKREVPSGGLPSNVGCIVSNVATARTLGIAVTQGTPLIRRVVTLSGSAMAHCGNYDVPLGMKLSDVVELAGGFSETDPPKKLISGGPMMGNAIFDLSAPVTKACSGLVALNEADATLPAEQNCIRCGKCIEACPMGLMPTTLSKLARKGDLEGFVANHGLDCIECGCCSFACPAKRYLAQSIRAAKHSPHLKR